MAFDPPGNLYVTDAFKGVVWKIDASGNAVVWSDNPLLLPQVPPIPFPIVPGPGANGIAINQTKSIVYVLNTTLAGVVQIALNPDGSAGATTVLVNDPRLVGADGLELDANGNLYIAVNSQNRIAVVTPEGQLSVLAEGGLLNVPSSLAFGKGASQNVL